MSVSEEFFRLFKRSKALKEELRLEIRARPGLLAWLVGNVQTAATISPRVL